MEGLSAKDLQIFREKSRAFIGSVRIPLDKLQHEELPDNPRQPDDKNIASRAVDDTISALFFHIVNRHRLT
ncbi:hypothetical protein V1524DRAFT_41087 [Lipomyces starkeyi]